MGRVDLKDWGRVGFLSKKLRGIELHYNEAASLNYLSIHLFYISTYLIYLFDVFESSFSNGSSDTWYSKDYLTYLGSR